MEVKFVAIVKTWYEKHNRTHDVNKIAYSIEKRTNIMQEWNIFSTSYKFLPRDSREWYASLNILRRLPSVGAPSSDTLFHIRYIVEAGNCMSCRKPADIHSFFTRKTYWLVRENLYFSDKFLQIDTSGKRDSECTVFFIHFFYFWGVIFYVKK